MISPSSVPRLAEVRLYNIRGFDEFRLDLGKRSSSRRNAALIIGRNGTNKSTLLRAIAIGVASSTDASALLSMPLGGFVRHGQDSGRIELELEFDDGRRVQQSKTILSKDAREILGEANGPTAEELNLLVCGYGAARGITGTDVGRDYRVLDSVRTLFDYRSELLAPELTLRRLSDYLGEDLYRSTLAGIARVMGLEGRSDEIKFARGGGVVISSPSVGTDVPLEGLADGYRVVFNWLIDMFGRALRPGWITDNGSVAGIILIDELDQHLHPELQTAVMRQLTDLLPDAQIIATTHSPLIALGAEPEQLVVLEREGDRVVFTDRVPDYRGYSPEDMLTDNRLFDTEAWNPDTRESLEQYSELAAIPDTERSEEQKKAFQSVGDALRKQPLPPAMDQRTREAVEEIAQIIRKST